MIWSKARWQHSMELFPRVMKEVAFYLIPLSITLWGLEYYVASLHQARFDNPYEASTLKLVSVGLGAFVLESLITVTWLIMVAKSTQRQAFNHNLHSQKF